MMKSLAIKWQPQNKMRPFSQSFLLEMVVTYQLSEEYYIKQGSSLAQMAQDSWVMCIGCSRSNGRVPCE